MSDKTETEDDAPPGGGDVQAVQGDLAGAGRGSLNRAHESVPEFLPGIGSKAMFLLLFLVPGFHRAEAAWWQSRSAATPVDG